ncbi:MAG: 3-isopropylmalate dehydratase small subunit [Bryobacterales bacterium]|jgi:3-isopropylmalate/(R)-2-methylmalate dehydratase small subunit|nr:3-isopropylmalate dehydratase small subunit [Bryobacterales bacterium]
MIPFTTLTSRILPLPIDNIDTDQIIPARFLKTISKEGLDRNLFCDWRYHEDGSERADFILNQPEAQGAQILLAGDNFGCGSSREHAPWALTQFGFRAILSSSFADIFRGNALKNSLLPVVISEDVKQELFALRQKDAGVEVSIDLESQTLTLPDGRQVEFPVDPFSKYCLLNGVDELGYLVKHEAEIAAWEARQPWALNTLGA